MLTARRPLTHLLLLAALGLSGCGPAATPAKPDAEPATAVSLEAPKPAPIAAATPEGPKPAPVAPATPPDPLPAISDPGPPQVQPVDEATRAGVADSINAFAIDLHREIAGRPGNLFVSPASIAIAFAMTHAGARGRTEQEIAQVFHFGSDAVKTREGFAAALAGWAAPQKALELSVVNRLFGEKTLKFEPAFVDITRTIFAAPLEPTDFKRAAEPARQHINAWVEEQTHDKIRDLIPAGALTEETRLVLVNAVYFKAAWRTPFAEALTRKADFHGVSGEKTVKMMEMTQHLAVHVDAAKRLKVLELPYSSTFSFVIVLPDARDGLAAIEASLDVPTLERWISGLRKQRVALKLPRFKIEPGAGLRLRTILIRLGMRDAFDFGSADFTGMVPRTVPIVVDEAYHKAFVAVDEKGTEAAAATAVVMATTTSLSRDEPLAFTADHPFLFMIRDVKSGAILFMGRLSDPA